MNVLDRNMTLQDNLLLEASAGTGKTFSIEHIVVRLLIENWLDPPPSLDQILVVTFTRAATRDLKGRIRATIVRVLEQLQQMERGVEVEAADFVLPFATEKAEMRLPAIRALQRALLVYDDAPIFTIHSFCAQMLQNHPFEGDLSLQALKGIQPLTQKEGLRVVRDFFRTELKLPRYHPRQMQLALSFYGGSLEKLESALLQMMMQAHVFETVPNYSDCVRLFQQGVERLKKEWGVTGRLIGETFDEVAPKLKGIRNRQRNIKPEVQVELERLIHCFDKAEVGEEDYLSILEDQLALVQLFPRDIPWIEPFLTTLRPLISPQRIVYQMAHDCRHLWERRFSEEEKLGFEELLQAMQKALSSPPFLKVLRGTYRAVIIDEFQDTDPLQWEIFEKTFFGQVPLVLVGDPKQSIYAFRNADIYTYLSASEKISQEHHGTLETNYRSTPALVAALNALFTAPKPFMELPRIGKTLPFISVHAAPTAVDASFPDSWGAVHILAAPNKGTRGLQLERVEKESFLPAIVREIQSLHLPLKEIAILVADRYQADRVGQFLNRSGIPTLLQRTESLRHSPALLGLREIVEAVLNPKELSLLKTALGGSFFGWSSDHLIALNHPENLECVLAQFYPLKEVLQKKGFAPFFESLIQTSIGEGEETFEEQLLSQNGGEELWNDLRQLVDFLLHIESAERATPSRLLEALYPNSFYELDDEESFYRRQNPDREGVQILTMHSSKGLEFGVVFTLGLLKRTHAPSFFIQRQGKMEVALHKRDPIYLAHAHEIDAEKMRQLYVAMTRAKKRLYLPVIEDQGLVPPNPGCASPMEVILGHFPEPLKDWIGRTEASITYESLDETMKVLAMSCEPSEPTLTPPPSVAVPGFARQMHSFTSLAKTLPIVGNAASGSPHNFDEEIKTPHTLPSGSVTGTLLHELLEEIQSIDDVESIVTKRLATTPYASWTAAVQLIIRSALLVDLDGFCLADVKPLDIYKETEFIYPSEDGVIKGVIDLAFTYRGKYYLLDWKSNWLGPDQDAYTFESLELAMQHHHYDLQAKIYTEAFQRYLSLVEEKPFDEVIGGVFYVFLRGVTGTEKKGVYNA